MPSQPSKDAQYHKGTNGKVDHHHHGPASVKENSGEDVSPQRQHPHATDVHAKSSLKSSISKDNRMSSITNEDVHWYTEILLNSQSKLMEGSELSFEYSKTVCTDLDRNVICTTETLKQCLTKSITKFGGKDNNNNSSMIGLLLDAGNYAKSGNADGALDCVQRVAEETVELIDSPKKSVSETIKVVKDLAKFVKTKHRRTKSRASTGKANSISSVKCGGMCKPQCDQCKGTVKDSDDEDSSE